MTTVTTSFVGCKVSQADGEEALASLVAAGLRPAAAGERADVVVVHTCCVTAEAERKSRQLVRRLAAGGARVLVAGCAAVLHPGQFAAAEGAAVLGRPDWPAVAATLGAPADDGRAGAAGEPPPAVADPASAEAAPPSADADPAGACGPGAGASARTRTRFVLKVQDGCDERCTFCVVRLVRGRPRSTSLGDALTAARAALSGGCGELVLSGVDLGAWRDGTLRLPDLVGALAELPGLARLRLSSLEPRHVDGRLLEALAHPRVARHLHVPLQSGDDFVLAAMGRPYAFADYEAAVARMQARLGDCMLSTDVIAGFPTEDEAAFARTLGVVESGLFGRVHVFGYSPRPGTAAARLPSLPRAVVKDRVRRALAAAEAAARSARRSAIGRPAEVLVEERRGGLWRGYSSEYVRYYLEGMAHPGALVRAVACEDHEDGVKGHIA